MRLWFITLLAIFLNALAQRTREREEKKETRDKIEHIYIRLVVAKEPALHEKSNEMMARVAAVSTCFSR